MHQLEPAVSVERLSRHLSPPVQGARKPDCLLITRLRAEPEVSRSVAKLSDSVSTINAALDRSLDLLLTPGVYNLDPPITVKRAGTVVLGLGMATLTAAHGNAVLTTADVPGIDIAGVTVDAGPVNSPVSMRG